MEVHHNTAKQKKNYWDKNTHAQHATPTVTMWTTAKGLNHQQCLFERTTTIATIQIRKILKTRGGGSKCTRGEWKN